MDEIGSITSNQSLGNAEKSKDIDVCRQGDGLDFIDYRGTATVVLPKNGSLSRGLC